MAKPRQAVVVIHGIGEQRPMDTLRSFVSGVLEAAGGQSSRKTFNKPDFNADGYELRRYRSFVGQEDSDFVELYWQHLMPVAGWRFMLSWLWRLMLRPAKAMPARFAFLWWLCWLALIAFLVMIFWSVLAAWQGWADPFVSSAKLSGGAAIVAAAAGGVFLAYVGDAAIYLNPHPRTVEARNNIRAAGLQLIERLQQDTRYDRIIVVGHSLGSVIGYDILNFAWQRTSDEFRRAVDAGRLPVDPSKTDQPELANAETLAASADASAIGDDWPGVVRRTYQEMRALGLDWKVTDLVTLGSPLAHATLLLARGREDLQRRFDERELPKSPPHQETAGHFSYERATPSKVQIRLLDHAAVFGLVCWTNLYFPCRVLLWGDAIGGAVAPVFGAGVQDRPVRTSIRGGFLTHTAYWTAYKDFTKLATSSLVELAAALDLSRATTPPKPQKAVKPTPSPASPASSGQAL